MEVGEFAFPIDPVEKLIRGMGQGAYRGRRGEGGYSQSPVSSLHSPFPRLIHFLLLIRLFRKIASDELDELDDDDKDEDGSHHDVGLETLVAVADGEVA